VRILRGAPVELGQQILERIPHGNALNARDIGVEIGLSDGGEGWVTGSGMPIPRCDIRGRWRLVG
jgi:hypothetical protein